MINIVYVSYTVLYIIQYISRYISDFMYVSDTFTQHMSALHILYNYQQNRLVTKRICKLHAMQFPALD